MGVSCPEPVTEGPAGDVAAPLSLGRPRILATLWLLAWSVLALWAAHALATAWPYQLLPHLIVLVFAVPGMLFRGFDLLYMRLRARRCAGWRRAAARLAAMPIGLVAAGFLYSALERVSMASFEREIDAYVRQVEANATAPCPPQARYVVDAALNAYLDRSKALMPVELHYDARHFVLAFLGRSIDIDGSTVYYDSSTRIWRKFHNDSVEDREAFAALVKDMAECRFRLR